MACTNPRLAYKFGVTENGKQKLVFKRPEQFIITEDNTLEIPCGKCISCKLSYAKEWALRIYHEVQYHPLNCFLTLTYDEEHLPDDKSVHRTEVVNFVKRLRKHISKEKPGLKIKVFYCGEYGDKRSRPHRS